MRTAFFAFALLLLYALHQDFWFWRSARPLVFGFLPIGLFYHALYTLACVLCFWAMVRMVWPGHLEVEAEQDPGSKERRP